MAYWLNGAQITHMTHGNEWMHFYYDGQGRPSIMNYVGNTYHYLYALQGDVIGLVDSSGTLVVEYKYDAWGALLGKTGTLSGTLGELNPFRYRGYVYDEETGLYYLRSRYYNPEWGRFISADALLGKTGGLLGHNLYCYCRNNPVMLIDPDGYESAAATWFGTMWWLCATDGPLPIGDIVFAIGWAATAASDAFYYWGVWNTTTVIYGTAETISQSYDSRIVYAKGHQGNMRDTGLRDVTDEELDQLIHDPNTTKEDRQKYVREQKARKLRNIKKRKGYDRKGPHHIND